MAYDNDLRMVNNKTYDQIKNIPPGERGLTTSDQGFSMEAISQGLSPASRGAFSYAPIGSGIAGAVTGHGGK